jgi:predicted transcriptional regulator
MKSVMLSIRPKWCEKITSGEKTIEVRKTKPKLETPFKCYIYCTSGRPDLNIPISPERLMQDYLDTGSMQSLNCPLGNGKVIGEFTCDRIYGLAPLNHAPDDVEKQACLTREEIVNYLKGTGYGWHIVGLRIYDQPRELSEFTGLRNTRFGAAPYDIKRPPQSWCYVEKWEKNDGDK